MFPGIFFAFLLSVFTLQSIKSRIETILLVVYSRFPPLFLLYSPLNQGLKPIFISRIDHYPVLFLLYSPLNQGLKLKFFRKNQIQELSFYSTVH